MKIFPEFGNKCTGGKTTKKQHKQKMDVCEIQNYSKTSQKRF